MLNNQSRRFYFVFSSIGLKDPPFPCSQNPKLRWTSEPFFKTVLKKMYFFLSIAFDHCHYSPCLNNGTCYNLPINFTCDCMPGFSGPSCESEYQRRNSWREKNFSLSSFVLFPLLLPPSPCPSFSQSISPTSPFLLLLLLPHPPPSPFTPYYKFSPITPSPSSPHFSSVFYSFFLFLLFLSLVFLLRRPSFPSVSCQPPFPLFFTICFIIHLPICLHLPWYLRSHSVFPIFPFSSFH